MQERHVNDAGSYHITTAAAIGRRRAQKHGQHPSTVVTGQRTQKSSSSSSPVFEFTICVSPRKSSVTTICCGDDDFFTIARRSSVDTAANLNLLRHLDVDRRKPPNYSPSPMNRVSAGAKEVIRRYLEKVKPLYGKLSQKQHRRQKSSDLATGNHIPTMSVNCLKENHNNWSWFSGNFSYPRSRISSSCISRSSSSMVPSHRRGSVPGYGLTCPVGTNSDASSMEEVRLAIQGAIAHCKNSMSMTMSNSRYLAGDQV